MLARWYAMRQNSRPKWEDAAVVRGIKLYGHKCVKLRVKIGSDSDCDVGNTCGINFQRISPISLSRSLFRTKLLQVCLWIDLCWICAAFDSNFGHFFPLCSFPLFQYPSAFPLSYSSSSSMRQKKQKQKPNIKSLKMPVQAWTNSSQVPSGLDTAVSASAISATVPSYSPPLPPLCHPLSSRQPNACVPQVGLGDMYALLLAFWHCHGAFIIIIVRNLFCFFSARL